MLDYSFKCVEEIHKNYAYSLVELLIVITIVALLIVAGVGAYSNQHRVQVYNGAIRHIDGLIKSARNGALSGKIVKNDTGQEDPGTGESGASGAIDSTGQISVDLVPLGVYFHKSGNGGRCVGTANGSVVFFHDSYPADTPNYGLDTTNCRDKVREDYNLPGGVIITDIKMQNSAGWQDSEEGIVMFKPPRADVIISDNTGALGGIILRVELSMEAGSARRVYFNIDARTGSVELSN